MYIHTIQEVLCQLQKQKTLQVKMIRALLNVTLKMWFSGQRQLGVYMKQVKIQITVGMVKVVE